MTGPNELRDLIDSVMSSYVEEPVAGALPALWATLVGLGLPTVGISEAANGSGGTLGDVVLLVESLAKHGVSTPLVEATVSNWVLAESGRTSDGLTSIALPDADIDDRGGTLSGSLASVGWGRSADALVVMNRNGRAWLVDVASPGVVVEIASNVAGEPRDTVYLSGCAAVLLQGAPSRALVRARLGLLWAAAICGAASGAYELTRRYVIGREQFGQPLVRIAAVANSLALMRVHVLQARAGVDRALEGWDQPARPEQCLNTTAVARITAGATATEVAQLAHQLHGAIGITQEYPLHRLTRRLWAWRDAETSEREWALRLGKAVLSAGELGLWDSLSA
jgi:acyl-CoA dehydrogenase